MSYIPVSELLSGLVNTKRAEHTVIYDTLYIPAETTATYSFSIPPSGTTTSKTGILATFQAVGDPGDSVLLTLTIDDKQLIKNQTTDSLFAEGLNILKTLSIILDIKNSITLTFKNISTDEALVSFSFSIITIRTDDYNTIIDRYRSEVNAFLEPAEPDIPSVSKDYTAILGAIYSEVVNIRQYLTAGQPPPPPSPSPTIDTNLLLVAGLLGLVILFAIFGKRRS